MLSNRNESSRGLARFLEIRANRNREHEHDQGDRGAEADLRGSDLDQGEGGLGVAGEPDSEPCS